MARALASGTALGWALRLRGRLRAIGPKSKQSQNYASTANDAIVNWLNRQYAVFLMMQTIVLGFQWF